MNASGTLIIDQTPDKGEVLDSRGRTLTRDVHFPDILVYSDTYGNQYGQIDGRLVHLIGDIGQWYKFGADTSWAEYLLPYGHETEEVRTQNITVSGKSISRKMHIRPDLLGQYTAVIATDRANKPAPPIVCERKLQKVCSDKCIFSPQTLLKVTPEPRVYHEDGTVSVPNLFPFMNEHYVSVLPFHPSDILDFDQTLFHSLLRSGRDLAKKYLNDPEIASMDGFMNQGEQGNASQGHSHVQWGGRPEGEPNLTSRERDYVEKMGHQGVDIFAQLLAGLRNNPLYIGENPVGMVYAPFAPSYPDQVDIVVKPGIISNLDQLTNHDLDLLGDLLWQTVISLAISRNVTDYNLLIHQDNFESMTNVNFLPHFHLLPRNKRKEAGSEINGSYVVDIFPETTATAMREAMGAPA